LLFDKPYSCFSPTGATEKAPWKIQSGGLFPFHFFGIFGFAGEDPGFGTGFAIGLPLAFGL